MKYILLTGMLLLAFTGLSAQHSIKISIKDKEEKNPLAGASVAIQSINKTVVADSLGIAVFTNIAAGVYKINISYVGMGEQEINITVPQPGNLATEVFLEAEEEAEEEVIVTATRISRTISDIPTRVETISGEELTEKGNMKPGDIRMLLNESTGIQTQQTSATSYNSSIRIQGLDGRYTQVLRDGFPLYAGFSGGLSLMQVAPLDLKQIEVIKGSASTLYGAGAIAGLVNLVSKTPTAKRDLNFLANGTSAGGFDLSGFYSQKFNKLGITVFGSSNSGKAYDPAGIGLTAIPEFERYTINPRLFFYGEKTTANIGFSYITEKRTGGSMDYINKGTTGYFEKNNTDRFTTQAQLTHKLTEHSQLNFKNSYSRFNRLIELQSYLFAGVQQSAFSEVSWQIQQTKTEWVIGANLLTDDFEEEKQPGNPVRDYHYNTAGIFLQNTWSPGKQFTLETGLRGDYTANYGFELLPRISGMLRLTPQITARAGGGFGYKTPTVFNEESEKTQFQNILPIDPNKTLDERSAGVNFDINYRTRIGTVGFTINQLFFYTRLNKPLVLTAAGSNYEFLNAPGHIDTRGMETNLRFVYDDFKLFVGYTYADVNTHYNNTKAWLPLTARHRLNNVLMYEQEGKLKIGLEGYFFSPQLLNDGKTGRAYWTFGLMGEKTWKHFSIFLNFENFTDTRQTKFDTIYTGPITNPSFRDIYAPVDGFVVNGGIKLRL
jgi:outer membrane receptor for ferrienterochelin and colicins